MPRVLYLLHRYYNRGGVEEHTRQLAQGLASTFDTWILAPEQDTVRLLRNGREERVFRGELCPWPQTPYSLPRLEEVIVQVLDFLKPDIIHVQHFMNWHMGVLDQLAATGIPLVLSFHDYYAVTPHYTMQHVAEPRDVLRTEYSLTVFGQDLSSYLLERRKQLIASFSKIDWIVVPSRFLSLELAKAYPRQYTIIEHGIDYYPLKSKEPAPGKLRFGYVGLLIPQKGWRTLLSAFLDLQERHPEAELTFWGGGETPPQAAMPGISFKGPYEQRDLPDIAATIDVAVIPSEFRETYSYVLSEMWRAGIPVLASAIGALNERIIDNVNGKKFAVGNVQELADSLAWFSEHDEWRRWTIPRPRGKYEMLRDYENHYRRMLRSRE